MKKSSKHSASFNNVLLKRWLLRVGPVRRKILLKKFKDYLVRLRLGYSAVRKGLVQLSSRPVVYLNRVTTTTQRSKKRGGNCHLSSTLHEREQPFDKNNNGKNVLSLNVAADCRFPSSMYKEESHLVKTSAHWSNEPNTSCLEKNKSKSQMIADKSSRKIRTRSPSERERGSETNKLVRPENPNGITWRLIPIDRDWRPKPPSADVLLRQQKMESKLKRKRKMEEIFGQDSDIDEYDTCPATQSRSKCSRNSSSSKNLETELGRKSPIFSCSRNSKKSKAGSDEGRVRSRKTGRTLPRSGSDTPTQSEALRDSARKQTLQAQNISDSALFPDHRNVSTPASTSCIDACDRENTIEFQGITEKQSKVATSTTTTSDNGLCKIMSTVDNPPILTLALLAELQNEDGRSDNGLDSGLTLDSINSSSQPSATIEDSTTETETTTSQREESLAVEHGIKKGQLVEADSVTETTEMETQKCTVIDSDEAVSEVETMAEKMRKPRNASDCSSLNSTSFCVSNSSDRQFSAYPGCIQHTDDLKKEPVSSNEETTCRPLVLEFDRKPSSTTDTEPNMYEPDVSSCATDRLLGALDKIFLTLLCRRRVYERQQEASKLALERHQQEEILIAQHELESKFISFRDEICYLFNKLFTKDQVITFIAQGLDHRTPSGTEPFTKKEIDLTIIEAGVQIPLLKAKTESSTLPSEQTEPTDLTELISATSRVICTIDLTDERSSEDNAVNACDSSTHPLGSKNNDDSESGSVTNVGCGNDHNANDIRCNLPSISEVKTISTQQFETIGEIGSSVQDKYPCNRCARTSLVACSRCVQAFYCSRKCHKLHWEVHYTKCIPYSGISTHTSTQSIPI